MLYSAKSLRIFGREVAIIVLTTRVGVRGGVEALSVPFGPTLSDICVALWFERSTISPNSVSEIVGIVHLPHSTASNYPSGRAIARIFLLWTQALENGADLRTVGVTAADNYVIFAFF